MRKSNNSRHFSPIAINWFQGSALEPTELQAPPAVPTRVRSRLSTRSEAEPREQYLPWQSQGTSGKYGLVAIHFALLLSCFLVGCKGSQIGAHRWGGSDYGQGSVERQKARAVYFDPYPLNDIGPEVVGGRPRGFQNPLPEANRNELKNPWAGYSR